MAIVEALQSAQFVVNGQGHRTAVFMDIQAWDTLIGWLEDVIDTKIALQSLTALKTVGGRPQNTGWLKWDEIRAAVDAFIERKSQDCGELTARVFYDALENIFRKPEEAVTVEVEAQVIGSELQFALPDVALPGITIHNNQIMINNVRFVIHLLPAAVA